MPNTPTNYQDLVGNTGATQGAPEGNVVDLERRETEQNALKIDTVALTAAIRAEKIVRNVGYRD